MHFKIIANVCISLLFVISSSVYAMPMQIPEGSFKKQRIPFNEYELANYAYAKCLAFLESGDEVQASIGLQKIIDRMPHYHPARIKLIEIYNKVGLDIEANKLIEDGLRIDNNNVNFILKKSAMLLEKNQAEESLSLLLKVSEKEQHNVDYKSVLAATYFNLKLYDLASKNYNYLVRQNLQNSKWWLGLALSLDNLGDSKGAINGFKRVLNLGGVNTDTLHYVKNRLAQLELEDKK